VRPACDVGCWHRGSARILTGYALIWESVIDQAQMPGQAQPHPRRRPAFGGDGAPGPRSRRMVHFDRLMRRTAHAASTLRRMDVRVLAPKKACWPCPTEPARSKQTARDDPRTRGCCQLPTMGPPSSLSIPSGNNLPQPLRHKWSHVNHSDPDQAPPSGSTSIGSIRRPGRSAWADGPAQGSPRNP